jgi:glycosyltransferase involved in cell wall biosynthesis
MARICITLGSHLCRNPRAVREASALAGGGHDVLVLGPIFAEAQAAEDEQLWRNAPWRYVRTADLRPTRANRFQRFKLRAARRCGAGALQYAGIELAESIGYGIRDTLERVRHTSWDLHIGHQEVGCWISYRLLKEGRRVGADFEDWYSRDLLPEAQRGRPNRLLRKCEQALLKGASHLSTTSCAMAAAMQQAYKGRLPTVIYNVFPWNDRHSTDNRVADRVEPSKPSLHWVSQTIGPGRGLEMLWQALALVAIPVEVHLRGSCSAQMKSELEHSFPSRQGHTLFIHAAVPANELLSRISEHDIGLALERGQPDSRDLTVTYKFFHYLLAGLAIVATSTKGQLEIATAVPDAVKVCRQGDAKDMAKKITDLLADPGRLASAKEAARNAAETRFCWERQAPLLLESVERALQ